MSTTYLTVTISGHEYEVYADLPTADAYLAAEPSAALWRTGDEDANGRADVSATRILNRMQWPGEKTDPAQALAWPRKNTGLADVDDDTIPQAIIDGSIELANAIRNGYDAANQTSTTASNVKRQKAGSVEIEYFSPDSDAAMRLPLPVTELIGPYLAGAGGFGGSFATGTDGCSDFRRDKFARSAP